MGSSRPSLGLPRPGLYLTVGPPGPPLAWRRGLLGPGSRLWVASAGPAPASRRPSWDITAAFRGLAFAPLHPLQALDFLQSASPGPALPPGGLCRPRLPLSRSLRASSSLPAASAGPSRPQVSLEVGLEELQVSLPGPAPSSWRPLQVQNFLKSASPGPAPPASQWPLSAQPSSWLSAAFPGPAFDFRWPLQAQNLTSSRPLQAQPPASQRPARARPRPHSGLSTPS
nr:putative uncharacterized protein FLJ44672 [Pongo pygmaeus]